jgi:hypothetical protein
MHAAPDKRAPPGNRLAGGALAGSGPGTSPCIDGLSLVTGMVVPQAALLLKPAARSSVVGWMPGVWGGGIRTQRRLPSPPEAGAPIGAWPAILPYRG